MSGQNSAKVAKLFIGISCTWVPEITPVTDFPVKWTQHPNYHITLCFLGMQQVDQIPLIASLLKSTASRHSSFPLTIEGAGAFPNPQHAKVLYLSSPPNTPLATLASEISEQMLQSKILERIEHERYVAHLTIARSKRSFDGRPLIEKLNSLPSHTQHIQEFILYESLSTPKGVAYQPLHRFMLGSSS